MNSRLTLGDHSTTAYGSASTRRDSFPAFLRCSSRLRTWFRRASRRKKRRAHQAACTLPNTPTWISPASAWKELDPRSRHPRASLLIPGGKPPPHRSRDIDLDKVLSSILTQISNLNSRY